MASKPCRVGCECHRHSRPDVATRNLGATRSVETVEKMSVARREYWSHILPWWRRFAGKYYVYYLVDPYSNEIRWVGATTNVWKRYLNHCTVPSVNSEHWEWVESLRPERPTLVIKCIVETREEAERLERQLTRLRGAALLNKYAASSKWQYHLLKGVR